MHLQHIHHDVLTEIFFYCIPDNPLEREQPDTRQAPMLLCQICSGWRYVALSTPRLWMYLSYVLGTWRVPNDVAVSVNDQAFLSWWRIRLAGVYPFLRLSSARYFQFSEIDLPARNLLLDLILSAKYLNLDRCCSRALVLLDKREPFTYARLGTLVLTEYDWNIGPTLLPKSPPTGFPLSPNNTTIRQLITSSRHVLLNDVQRLNAVWSHLTYFHASLIIDITIWLSLIRECDALVSGSFWLWTRNDLDTADRIKATVKTLPRLQQLQIRCPYVTSFLLNLILPNLSSLFIHHDHIYNDHASIGQINQILSATPALKKLHLFSKLRGSRALDVLPRYGAFIEGDISPNSLSLCNLVPKLHSLTLGAVFRGLTYNSMRPDIIMQALTGPWIGLGQDGNKIAYVEFASFDQQDHERLQVVVENVKKGLSTDVELVVKPQEEYSQWESFRWSVERVMFTGVCHGVFPDSFFREVL